MCNYIHTLDTPSSSILCPLKYQAIELRGSDDTRQTMETFFPFGTVRYMEVGDSWGAQANSDRLNEGTWKRIDNVMYSVLRAHNNWRSRSVRAHFVAFRSRSRSND